MCILLYLQPPFWFSKNILTKVIKVTIASHLYSIFFFWNLINYPRNQYFDFSPPCFSLWRHCSASSQPISRGNSPVFILSWASLLREFHRAAAALRKPASMFLFDCVRFKSNVFFTNSRNRSMHRVVSFDQGMARKDEGESTRAQSSVKMGWEGGWNSKTRKTFSFEHMVCYKGGGAKS